MHGSPPRRRKRWIATQLLLATAGLVALADVGGGPQAIDRGSAAAAVAADRQPDGLRDLADDPPRIEPASWIGGPITSLAPAGDLAWLAQGRRVWAVDLADPERPRDLGPGLRFDGAVDALAVDGTLGLVAVGAELWALNLADARAPRRSGRLSLPRSPGDGEVVEVERILLHNKIAVIRRARQSDDLFIDLQRPATPLALPSSPVNLPSSSVIEAFQSVGDVVVMEANVPPEGATLFLLDRRKPLTARPLGRMVPAPHWSGVREDDGAERLVGIDPGGAANAYLTLTSWDLSSPSAPRIVERKTVPSPISENCSTPMDSPTLTRDGGLYVACTTRFGSFYLVGALVRWSPDDPESGTPWTTVIHALYPFDREIISFRERLFAVSSEGVHIYHSPRGIETRHPVLQSAVGLVADLIAGRASLLVNAGGLRLLDLRQPLDPVLLGEFWFGETEQVTFDDGMAVIDFRGVLEHHTFQAHVADLTESGTIGDAGSIPLGDTEGTKVRMAQGGRMLAVIARDAQANLYRLDPSTEPRRVGTVTAPGGTLVAIAMHSDLLATLSLERTLADSDATTPMTVALFRIQYRRDTTAEANLVGQRTLTNDAWTNPYAASLVMTADWLAVSMGVGCGRQTDRGVMLLRLGPSPDESSLFRQTWISRPTGMAVGIHDGYLFLQEPGWISALDIRQVAERPWAWREAARLLVKSPHAMTALDHTVYVSTGSMGVAIFQPDLPWASDPTVPTPTEAPTQPPQTPTASPEPCLSATPSTIASTTATATVSRTPTATRTLRVSATPTRAPGRRLWLPLVGD